MIVTAIIPAAGLGLRLKSAIPKPLVRIGAKPILMHTLKALSKNRYIQHIIVAVPKDTMNDFETVVKKNKIGKKIKLIPGGETRRESVENCLRSVPSKSDTVLIHDAVRPFITEELIATLLEEVRNNPAVICGVPVKATIKRVNPSTWFDYAHHRPLGASGLSGECLSGFVKKTIKRDALWEIQTPQVFKKNLLLKAYARCKDSFVTDDAALVEELGVKVKIIQGSYFNIKITTPEDLVFAKAIMDAGYA